MSQERNIPKKAATKASAVILLADNFVVGAEDMLANEAGRSSVGALRGSTYRALCSTSSQTLSQILQG